MKHYLMILLMIFSSFSCATNKRTVIKYSIKLEGKNTNIRDLIDIDGYFSYSPDHRLHLGGLMFFEDGTFISDFHFIESATIDSVQKNMTKWMDNWIDKNGQIQWVASDRGTYRIEGDTIIVRTIFISNALLRGWESTEYRFKVIDRNTINKFYYTYSPDKASSGEKVDCMYMFVPCDSLPTANIPLKENKWIWRNEQDWKDYMQRIEQIKIKKK
ncbi:MAG: hypothetical protein FWD60_10475 [Candidatus Azobacteroides sp.]|nr:hypothetical protein [Candidatus Azobacteroides sp.]